MTFVIPGSSGPSLVAPDESQPGLSAGGEHHRAMRLGRGRPRSSRRRPRAGSRRRATARDRRSCPASGESPASRRAAARAAKRARQRADEVEVRQERRGAELLVDEAIPPRLALHQADGRPLAIALAGGVRAGAAPPPRASAGRRGAVAHRREIAGDAAVVADELPCPRPAASAGSSRARTRRRPCRTGARGGSSAPCGTRAARSPPRARRRCGPTAGARSPGSCRGTSPARCPRRGRPPPRRPSSSGLPTSRSARPPR